MNDLSESTTFLARAALAQGVVHLGSAVAFAFTTPFRLYMLGDYVSVLVLVLGSLGVLWWNWGAVLLCAGWAFELAIYLRAVLSRLDTVLASSGQADRQLVLQLCVMTLWLVLIVVAFLFSVRLCIRNS